MGERTIAALTLTASLLAACSREEAPSRRGAFAFHYAPSLSDEQIEWYSRFEILVTHDPIPSGQVQRLQSAGTKLLLYEWTVAFYDSLASPWQKSLLARRNQVLLNNTPLTGALGSSTAGAWYYDPASREHHIQRAIQLARKLETTGYDGIFFDTTTIESVHPEAQKEFATRHPGLPYDAAFSRFLARLRKEIGNGIIFTNQGYRRPQYYLPHADWDLTESLITRPAGSSYELRPWNAKDDPWNSIFHIMREEIQAVTTRYPNVKFGHLNYIGEPSPETIHVIVATAQLFGGEGFVAAPSLSAEIDPIYFRIPGAPASKRVDTADGTASYRFFDNGLIVVSASTSPVIIETGQGYRDHLSGELHCGETITIPPSSGEPRAFFFDSTNDCNTDG